jgi:hypothetical protein
MALSDYLTKMTQMQTLGGTQPMQSPIGQPPVAKSKNEKLAYMLYALGGALRGDKNFVQNTLALQQMEEGKKKKEAQKKAFDEFLGKYEGKIDSRITDFAKVLGPEKGSQIVMKTFVDTEDTPADIQKLERYGIQKSKLDPESPNYDPTYTLEQLNQDASILGVTSKALQITKKQYIDDYMKQGRNQKTLTGQRLYTDEQLRDMAENSYNLVYDESEIPTPPPAVDDEGEDIIDLGTL